MADMGHMHANLVGAACFQLAFNQAAERRQISQGFVMSDSMATAGLNCLPFAVNWMPGKGGVYCICSLCRQSPDQAL